MARGGGARGAQLPRNPEERVRPLSFLGLGLGRLGAGQPGRDRGGGGGGGPLLGWSTQAGMRRCVRRPADAPAALRLPAPQLARVAAGAAAQPALCAPAVSRARAATAASTLRCGRSTRGTAPRPRPPPCRLRVLFTNTVSLVWTIFLVTWAARGPSPTKGSGGAAAAAQHRPIPVYRLPLGRQRRRAVSLSSLGSAGNLLALGREHDA